MSLATIVQLSASRVQDARRRSFAWGVAAGEGRPRLARRHGLSYREVQELLASPGMAMLAWVWHGFGLHRRRGGLADVFQMVLVLFREALAGRYDDRLRPIDLLGSLLGLVGYALLGVTRDLCAEIDRHTGRRVPERSPLGPARLRMVHAMAELIERVVVARLCLLRAADVATYVQDFRLAALEGLDPFQELLVTETAPTALGSLRPVPATARSAAAIIPWAEDARLERRRRPSLARPPPPARAA